MANGIRPIKKMSAHQLTEGFLAMNQRLDMLTHAVASDVQRLNIIVFQFLKTMGFAEEIVCRHCKVINMRPKVDGIEIDDRCADCGKTLEPLPDEAFSNAEVMDEKAEQE